MVISLPGNTAQDWHVDPRVMHELSHRVHVALYTNIDSVVEIELSVIEWKMSVSTRKVLTFIVKAYIITL
jgi:hypothetical protein